MNKTQLAEWLGLTQKGGDDLVAAGLPAGEGGHFDPDLVATWIESQGLGARTDHSGVVATQGDVARAFGVTVGTVKKDWRPSGMPGRPKHWDLAEIAAWKKLREKDSATTTAINGDGEAHDHLRRRLAADARKREGEAARIERENRQAEANILERDDVERLISEIFILTREEFRQIPRAMMPRYPKKHAQEWTAELERLIDQVLENMTKRRPKFRDTVVPPEESEP